MNRTEQNSFPVLPRGRLLWTTPNGLPLTLRLERSTAVKRYCCRSVDTQQSWTVASVE